MKHLYLSLFALFLWAFPAFAEETLIIGVYPFPHRDIIEAAKPLCKELGYTIEIKEYRDIEQPNVDLAKKFIFANFFQHKPFLDLSKKEKGLRITSLGAVHFEPMGVYSKNIIDLSELKEGATVAIPDDPTNASRALKLLETQELITLNKKTLFTLSDIKSNPLALKFIERRPDQIAKDLDEVTIAVINSNYACEVGLVPSDDALALENKQSMYANILVVRDEDKNSPKAKALRDAVLSPTVRTFIEKKLSKKGIVPAF